MLSYFRPTAYAQLHPDRLSVRDLLQRELLSLQLTSGGKLLT
ncbi:MAG: hypothetical protein ABI423_08265 [Burkholderiales bacterium]